MSLMFVLQGAAPASATNAYASYVSTGYAGNITQIWTFTGWAQGTQYGCKEPFSKSGISFKWSIAATEGTRIKVLDITMKFNPSRQALIDQVVLIDKNESVVKSWPINVTVAKDVWSPPITKSVNQWIAFNKNPGIRAEVVIGMNSKLGEPVWCYDLARAANILYHA